MSERGSSSTLSSIRRNTEPLRLLTSARPPVASFNPDASTSARHPRPANLKDDDHHLNLTHIRFHDAMLAFTPSSSPHAFLPAIPSPLSPRSANIHGPTRQIQQQSFKAMNGEQNTPETPRFTFDKSSLNTSTSPVTTPARHSIPFSQRSIKRAPSPKQNELTERRRSAFLRKVQDGREDRRYEMRGEDIMRLEFVRRRREEEERLAMSAPTPSAEEEEEEAELPRWGNMDVSCSSQVQGGEVEVVEEFVRDEEAEMRALLENLQDDEEMEGSDGSENLWSDDADYDALFSEMLRSDEQAGSSQGAGGEEMEMDMS